MENHRKQIETDRIQIDTKGNYGAENIKENWKALVKLAENNGKTSENS
jgi:uncharacterized protein with ACT and thioredoxin-like domain